MAPDINPSLPIVGQPDATEEPKIITAFQAVIAAINNLDSANIADGSLTGDDVMDGSIVTADLADAAVTTAKLADDSVTAAKLADDAVAADSVADSLLEKVGVNDATVTSRRGYWFLSTARGILYNSGSWQNESASGSLITVDQPTSGITLVFAQAQLKPNASNLSNLGLSVDGATPKIIGQTSTAGAFATVGGAQVGNDFCSPMVLFKPGTHTYRLSYQTNSVSGMDIQNCGLAVVTFGF